MALNPESDIDAKSAYIEFLLRERGFDEAKVTRSPADITARRGRDIFYFEIKFTSQPKQYFGAATLTEWQAALTHGEHYKFVVAAKRSSGWIFHEYTPVEFMAFSYVLPFKVFFNIPVSAEKATSTSSGPRRVRLTKECLAQMVNLYSSLRNLVAASQLPPCVNSNSPASGFEHRDTSMPVDKAAK
jgi:hypothetical protein